MDKNSVLKTMEMEMKEEVERFKAEIKKIHTGRATPILVENILIDYYGSKAPVKQVASINVPEPRMITIAPWNKDDLVKIEKAIAESDLKVNPQNDGVVVRITFPALTEERRIEMTKVLGKEKETARIGVRKVREETGDLIKKAEDDGTLSEDDKFAIKEEMQKIVDRVNKELEEIAEKKEAEIMTI